MQPYKRIIFTILSISVECFLILAYMGAFLFAQYDSSGYQTRNAYYNI